MVQIPATLPTWAGMVPPLKITVCVPGVAVTVPAPQVVLILGVAATTTPLTVVPGNGSVRETLLSWLTFVLVRVIVSVEIPLGLTVDGVNDLLTEIPLIVRLAVMFPAGRRFSLSEILAGEIVLVKTPVVLPVTFTARVQVCPAGIVPPL